MSAGKGDTPRPFSVTQEEFHQNFEAIDWGAREREAEKLRIFLEAVTLPDGSVIPFSSLEDGLSDAFEVIDTSEAFTRDGMARAFASSRPIADVIAEHERDPVKAEHLAKARVRVKAAVAELKANDPAGLRDTFSALARSKAFTLEAFLEEFGGEDQS